MTDGESDGMTDGESEQKARDPKTGRVQELGLGLLFTVTGGLIVALAILCLRNRAPVMSPPVCVGAIALGLLLVAMGIAAWIRAARGARDGQSRKGDREA